MIAVIFEVEPAEGQRDTYLDIAAGLRDELMEMDGFISIERFESLTQPGKKELEAALASARGDEHAAEAFLVEAAALEAELNAPSGPPSSPMNPTPEMYGEVVLARGRMEEAAVQFSKALERTPNRTRSVRGLERARRNASNVGLRMK